MGNHSTLRIFEQPNDSMRDRALALASLGFKVFKLRANEKLPAVENFHAVATSDPARVREMWTEAVTGESLIHNIGILTGAADAGLLVLDVDGKGHAEGKRGFESLEALVKENSLNTNTLTAITPSGGRHLFYRVPAHTEVSGSANKLGNGLDVRGYHQYVAAVGSVLPTGEYDWFEAGAPILDAPEWLIQRCKRAVPETAKPSAQIIEPDAAHNLSRAEVWLRESAQVAIEGQGGNDATFKVACHLKDLGLSEAATFVAMLENWNEVKASPAWESEDLARVVSNAYRYGRSPVGAATAEAEFEAVSIVPELPEKPRRLHPYNFADALSAPERSAYLVKGLLSRDSLAVLYGPPESGKTFVALDIAHCVASGRSFQGRRVKAGLVVYVACEGQLLFRRRLRALHSVQRNVSRKSIPLEVVHDSLNLRVKGDVDALVSEVNRLAAQHNTHVAMVVLDTLGRLTAGADENSFQDMSMAIGAADLLREKTGGTVLIVHHSGKDTSKGARGHSALRGAVDTELEVEKGKLTITKQRDGASAGPFISALSSVPLGVDEDGDPISSCVVKWKTASEFEKLPLPPAAQDMWEAFQVAAKEATATGGDWRLTTVSMEAWEKAYREIKIDDARAAGSECPRAPTTRHARRLRKKVKEGGHVREVEDGQWIAA